jgi:hypothetical protein
MNSDYGGVLCKCIWQLRPTNADFKPTSRKKEIKDRAPSGTILSLNSGSFRITKELFLVWTTHVINSVRSLREMKALLLLDGHPTFRLLRI